MKKLKVETINWICCWPNKTEELKIWLNVCGQNIERPRTPHRTECIGSRWWQNGSILRPMGGVGSLALCPKNFMFDLSLCPKNFCCPIMHCVPKPTFLCAKCVIVIVTLNHTNYQKNWTKTTKSWSTHVSRDGVEECCWFLCGLVFLRKNTRRNFDF